MDSNQIIAYFLALFVGISLGLIGSGGAILSVPILVYVLHIEPILATSYSLFILFSFKGRIIFKEIGRAHV